ncbi:MAG: hypothetical protein ACP5IN_03780 [Caldimicrobium sp.]
MWISIGKLELKKGFIYYFLLYLFFFFWSIFTLFSLFLYENLVWLNQNYFKKVGVSIIIYPQENIKSVEDIQSFFKKFNYITKLEVYHPKKLFQELEKDLPKGFLEENEIEEIFPYLIKVNLISIEALTKFKKDIEILKSITKNKLEILPEPNIKNLMFLKYIHFLLTIFLMLWTLFYFIFFIFLNRSLNNHLKTQTEIFQLLGGHILKLKLIRILIIIIPLLFIWIFSFIFYYLFAQNIFYFFPFLKIFPDLNNLYELLFFITYFLFLIVVYPIFLNFLSCKKL